MEKQLPAPRPRGRPRINHEPLVLVSTRVPRTYYDRLASVSLRRGCSVSEILRRVLIFRLPFDQS